MSLNRKCMIMTHTMQHVFAIMSLQFCIAHRLTHCTWICRKNHKHKSKPSVYMWGNSSHVLFVPKTLCISVEKVFAPENVCIDRSHSFWVYSKMGEALIDLVHQYPALWDKQDAMYKGSKYKEAKWKEITEIWERM